MGDKYMKSNDVAMADIRKDCLMQTDEKHEIIIDEVSDLVNGAKKEMLMKANEKHEKTIDEVSDIVIEAQNEMLMKADEKDVKIIKELSGIVYEIKDDMIAAKNEMLTENQDSQDKIKFIFIEFEEIKTLKKQKKEEDIKIDMEEHTVYEDSTDESDNDVEIYDDNEEDEDDDVDDDEINENPSDNKKVAWYKYSEKFIPDKYKSQYRHDKNKLIEEWYKTCIKINLLPEEFMIEPIVQQPKIKTKSFYKQRKQEWKQRQLKKNKT